ncbi:MAG: FAD-dependent oxidoreductase, partial [Melioribacteraceae bacterium]|nr:FAD-dependent oxidoreductase [Melioribacteraceae bacterium]
ISKLISEAEESSKWGVTFGKPKIELEKLREFKESVVNKMTGGLGILSKQRKVNYVQGRGKFLNSKSIHVDLVTGGSQEIAFDYAIIATGSVPVKVPGVSIDSEHVWDSTGALELSEIPKKLLVVGGGYIGLELGSVYASIGSKVSVVEMMPSLLPGADKDMVAVLSKSITPKFENVYLKTKVVSVEETKKGKLKVTFEGEKVEEKVQEFDKILVSVGRKPVTQGLGLENTSVKIGDKGFIETDAQLRTNDKNIFAIGDIVGQPMLAHKASAEGKVAVDVIAGHKAVFEPNAIPAVVFTDPELAWAGLTELEAKERGIKVSVAKFPWGASGRATTIGRNDGMTKLIIDPETERILGMGIVGAGAGEMIAEGVLAVEMSALAKDVAMSIHPHPTLSETVMESAEAFFGEATHIYRPKRK